MTISSYAEEQKLTFKYENSISNEYFFFVITKNDKNCILSIEGEKRNELELCPKDNELSLVLEDIFDIAQFIKDNENNFAAINSDITEQVILNSCGKTIIFLYYDRYKSIPNNGKFSDKIVSLVRELIKILQQNHPDLFVKVPIWLYG
ncbi:MAG: hypothetical protein IJT36_03680 [Alphaproteobacteria bacterium]|nr:hypothetical protein [Alphaproteobacteria bacterium]